MYLLSRIYYTPCSTYKKKYIAPVLIFTNLHNVLSYCDKNAALFVCLLLISFNVDFWRYTKSEVNSIVRSYWLTSFISFRNFWVVAPTIFFFNYRTVVVYTSMWNCWIFFSHSFSIRNSTLMKSHHYWLINRNSGAATLPFPTGTGTSKEK